MKDGYADSDSSVPCPTSTTSQNRGTMNETSGTQIVCKHCGNAMTDNHWRSFSGDLPDKQFPLGGGTRQQALRSPEESRPRRYVSDGHPSSVLILCNIYG